MNTFELNKYAGAILGTILVILVVARISETVFHHETEGQAYGEIAVAEDSHSTTAMDEPETPPLPVLLANGSAEAGERIARRCVSCHTFEKDGDHKVGPNLYNIVGATPGAKEGFSYSAPMADKGGQWTYEELDAFLASPRNALSGTKMSFAGLRNPEDRAAMLLYLRQFSDSPPPLPAN